MKKVTIALLITAAFAAGYTARNEQPAEMHTYETDDTFYNGEMLMPDYVHNDTLVVFDAYYLNKHIQDSNIASDGDINELLMETAVIYRKQDNK